MLFTFSALIAGHDNGYISTLASGSNSNTISSRNFFAYWCTDYAAYRIQKTGVPFNNQWPTGSGRWGNAAEWESRASSIGMYKLQNGEKAYGKNGIVLRASAQPADTAIWRRTSTNSEGHVAHVVSTGTLPTVEEYNWSPPFQFSKRNTAGSNWKPSIFLGITPALSSNAFSVNADATSLSAKINKQVETKIRVRNSSNTAFTITATSQDGALDVLSRTNNLNNTVLAPKGTGVVGVLFRPKKRGTYKTTFTLVSTAGMQSVTITGTAK